MAEHLRFVDATNGSPYYDSADFAQAEEVKVDGIAYNYLNELEVIQYGGLQVKVKDGALVSKGRTYIQDEPSDGDSPIILELDPTGEGTLRKDMVVVEFDLQNSLAATKIVKGDEVESNPALPSIEDESGFWQVCLAIVDVDGTAIINIEDKRVIGNGRTNPVFKEDISAPNIKVNDDGKLYLNDAETAYLRYESDTLNFKAPDRPEVNISGKAMFKLTPSISVSGTSGTNTVTSLDTESKIGGSENYMERLGYEIKVMRTFRGQIAGMVNGRSLSHSLLYCRIYVNGTMVAEEQRTHYGTTYTYQSVHCHSDIIEFAQNDILTLKYYCTDANWTIQDAYLRVVI